MNAPKLSRAEAYDSGLCTTCRVVPRSAGRPRCNACHAAFASGLESVVATGIPGLVTITLEVADA
jgi:hypothetical protein